MRTVIAGSRKIIARKVLDHAIDLTGWEQAISDVACGMALGVDLMGAEWAKERGIPVTEFPPRLADWDTFVEAAYARNQEMVDWADRGILLWDGMSTGTQDTAKRLARGDKQFYVFNTKDCTWTYFIGNEVHDCGKFLRSVTWLGTF